MQRKLLTIISAFFLLAPPSIAGAAEVRAFHNINQLPFKQIFGLPSLDNSPLTEAGAWRLNFIANISNTYDFSTNASEDYATDVETFRGAVTVAYAWRNNFQVGLEVPYINYDSGSFDDFIYNWHDFFNMPQNGRSEDTNDQFQVSYTAPSGSTYEMSGPESGIGDIRINCTYSRPWKDRQFIFSSELKLPTGDYDKLTGSGGYDLSVGLMFNDPQSLAKYRLTFFGGLAGIYLGDSDGDLAEDQNNFALAGRAGIGWQATKLIQLKMQLDAQSALYDSDLKELGDLAMQLVMGGSLTFSDKAYLDISVAEDIITTTAPDVAFQLALVLTF